jgi:GT2 family glycosyltransferase
MLRFQAPTPEQDQRPRGTVFSAVMLDSNALAIFGSCPKPLPTSGSALLVDGKDDRGIWHAVNWARPEDDQFGFFAILGVDSITQLHSGTIQIAQGATGVHELLPVIARVDLDTAALIECLRAEDAPTRPILDFLHGIVGAPGLETMHGIAEFRRIALETLSQQSGFVEIIARPECGGLLVQGWSCDLQSGFRDVVVQHEQLEIFEGAVAIFDREDLLDAARGAVLYFKDAASDAVLNLRRIYFSVDDRYFHLEIVQEPVRFAPEEAVPHLEQTIPVLQGDAPVIRSFKRICRPRYEGANTIDGIAAPVRLSVDCAFHVPGKGFLLTGWLLDPRDDVYLVLLKSSGNFYQRVHETWYRSPRPDVISGYSEDPSFAPHMIAASDQCGFLVFVPSDQIIDPADEFYLEFVLKDESCAFAPVTFDARPSDAIVSSILGSVDMEDLAFDYLVRMHLGPAVSGAFSARVRFDAAASLFPFGQENGQPRASIILPATGGGADIDINLSRLAGDPDLDDVELILVASHSVLKTNPARLQEWANFYGFNGQLVVVGEEADYFDALELGIRHAQADLVAFLADTVLPESPGWLGALIDELDMHPEAAAISPTLLYEDMSIRYAGLPRGEAVSLDQNGLRQLTGYPVHWLSDLELSDVHGVSEHCVLLRRGAFDRIDGFAREFTGPEFKGLDFSLRLRHAGLRLLWTPAVRLFSLDGGVVEESEEYWRRPALKIDAWCLSNKWSPAMNQTAIPYEVIE